MKKKERIKAIFYFILALCFISGYYLGTVNSKELEEKPKSAYQIIQEGYERVGK